MGVKLTKATMTLNLSQAEMAVVDQIASDQGMSKTQVLRQALRIYQMTLFRLAAGETMHWSSDQQRAVEFVGIGFPAARAALSSPEPTGKGVAGEGSE